MGKNTSDSNVNDLEGDHWRADHALRLREVEIKEREQKRWLTPLAVAIFVAALAAIGNAAVALINGLLQRDLEDRKAEAQLVLESIKTNGDAGKATNNLHFLVQAGLVKGQNGERLSKYLDSVKPEDRPVLGGIPCALPAMGPGYESALEAYKECVQATKR